MKSITELNKAVVNRFNYEFIAQGNLQTFKELVAEDVYIYAAPPGASTGPDSMIYFIMEVLRKGFPDIKIEIFDQVAEGDRVTTRKALNATHSGEFMGIPLSNKRW